MNLTAMLDPLPRSDCKKSSVLAQKSLLEGGTIDQRSIKTLTFGIWILFSYSFKILF